MYKSNATIFNPVQTFRLHDSLHDQLRFSTAFDRDLSVRVIVRIEWSLRKPGSMRSKIVWPPGCLVEHHTHRVVTRVPSGTYHKSCGRQGVDVIG